MNKAFRGTREHGIQFIWYEDEDSNQPRRSLLYEELAKDHNLNKACFQSRFQFTLKISNQTIGFENINKQF